MMYQFLVYLGITYALTLNQQLLCKFTITCHSQFINTAIASITVMVMLSPCRSCSDCDFCELTEHAQPRKFTITELHTPLLQYNYSVPLTVHHPPIAVYNNIMLDGAQCQRCNVTIRGVELQTENSIVIIIITSKARIITINMHSKFMLMLQYNQQ